MKHIADTLRDFVQVLESLKLPYASPEDRPEDLILLKLIAARGRDYLDAADVLFTQGQLDEEYMRKWARDLGVLDKLEELLAQRRKM